jgi:Spy/CpxP family protein refolding chaperone
MPVLAKATMAKAAAMAKARRTARPTPGEQPKIGASCSNGGKGGGMSEQELQQLVKRVEQLEKIQRALCRSLATEYDAHTDKMIRVEDDDD